jgi:hypothetical protein
MLRAMGYLEGQDVAAGERGDVVIAIERLRPILDQITWDDETILMVAQFSARWPRSAGCVPTTEQVRMIECLDIRSQDHYLRSDSRRLHCGSRREHPSLP